MANLIPCKSCQHQIDKSAKTCPNCGVKDPGVKGSDVAKGCLGIIVFAVIISFFMMGDDEKETKTEQSMAVENTKNVVQQTQQAELPLTIDVFIDRYNQSIANLGMPLIFKIKKENNATFISAQVSSTNKNLGLVISANKNRKVTSLTFIGTGDGTSESGLNIILASTAIIMAIEDPNMNQTSRASIAKDLGFLDGGGDHKFNRKNVSYSLTYNQSTGTWLTASPIVTSEPSSAITPEIKSEPSTARTIDDNNFNELINEMSNYYLANIKTLFQHYKQYEDQDRSVFILWRNNEWVPEHDKKRTYFDAILEKNRLYLFNNGAIPLFSATTGGLALVSLEVMKAIRENDQAYLQSARDMVKQDADYFKELIDSRDMTIQSK